MREVRRDPLTGRWVVLSTERVPAELLPPPILRQSAAECPFCPGNERATEPEIARIARDGRWVARAFPNRRPALVIEEELHHRGYGPYDRITGTGAHEVVVECREHDVPLWELPATQMADALELARVRLIDLRRDPRFRALWWFRNHGAPAGASIDHPHAQILATPHVPSVLEQMVERSRRHHRERSRELLQDVLDFEREVGRRLVWEGGRVVAFCAWAPASPFEVWFVPVEPAASFTESDERLVDELAVGMRLVLRQMARALGGPAHNAWLYDAPHGVPAPGFRWHLRLAPRLVRGAGYEVASGDAVHWVFPEEAAAALRG